MKSWCRIFRGSLRSQLASISGRLKTLIFQWARIEAWVWLYTGCDTGCDIQTRHSKIIVNVAVAIFRGQKIAEAPGCRIEDCSCIILFMFY